MRQTQKEIDFYTAISNIDKVKNLDYKNEKDYRRLHLPLGPPRPLDRADLRVEQQQDLRVLHSAHFIPTQSLPIWVFNHGFKERGKDDELERERGERTRHQELEPRKP